MKSICIFGDSTAWGAWDMEKGGWVNRLWLDISGREKTDLNHYNTRIYNLSISGGTTQTILDRFEAEAKIRKADALIFQSGGNDAYLIGKSGPNQILPEQFRNNIQEIIARAKNITPNIVFIGFKNVNENKTSPVSWADKYFTNSEIQKYDKIMAEICAENAIPYCSVFGLLDTKIDFDDDGLHPNAYGHEKLFQKIKGFLVEQKWL